MAMRRERFSARSAGLVARERGGWEVHFRAVRRREKGDDVIVLSVGDHDFKVDDSVNEAAYRSMTSRPQGYGDPGGPMALREAIAARMREETGLDIDTPHAVVTIGAQGALYSALQCLIDPGDGVLAVDPFYVTYLETVASAGGRLDTAPANPDDGFQIDPTALAAAVTPQTRALLLNTPSNPAGTIIDLERWRAIADLAQARDLWIVSDEVYADLIYDGRHVSLLDVVAERPALRERAVVLRSLSKGFAMTGWRVGWAIGPADLLARIEALAVALHYGLPGFIHDAGLAALARRDTLLPPIRALYHTRRDRFMAALSEIPTLRAASPAAGMFVMLDVRETGLGSVAFADRLLAEADVAVMPGASFGASAEGFVRVGLATDADRLEEAARRMAHFVNSL